MKDADPNTIAEHLQQLLEREYGHLAWHVVVQAELGTGGTAEPWLFVHARTRDFRAGCRIGRAWSAVVKAPTLRFLAAELVAEAERRVAGGAASA